MYKATFKLRTLTPLFIYGANGETPEIRAASIKGIMRFWRRAAKAESQPTELLKEENEIFGGSGENEGKSKVKLSINYDKLSISKQNLPDHNISTEARGRTIQINILNYLAYGITEYIRGQGTIMSKEYISPDQEFSLVLESFSENTLKEAVKSIYLLIKHSGIGTKTRNGFGCLKIIESNYDLKQFDNLYQKYQNVNKTSYTSFSKDFQYFKTENTSNSWDGALADIGKIYRYARLSLEEKHIYNRRQYISSPIQTRNGNKSFLEKHAKSIFMNIKEENPKSYRGYITFLPYTFLKDSEEYSDNHLKNYNEVYNDFIEKLREEKNNLIEITEKRVDNGNKRFK